MSSLVSCEVCNSQIADDAKTCLKCGTAGPRQKKKDKLILLLRLLGIAFIVIILGYILFVLIPDMRLHGFSNKVS